MPNYKWNSDTQKLEVLGKNADVSDLKNIYGAEWNAALGDGWKRNLGIAKGVLYIDSAQGSDLAFKRWAQARLQGNNQVVQQQPQAVNPVNNPVVNPVVQQQQQPLPVVESDWSLTQGKLLAGLAAGRALTDNCEIAFIWDPDEGNVLAVGKHAGDAANTFQTAIVNALQSTGEDLRGCWCVSSYKPTKMCEGMANVLQVKLAWMETKVEALKTVREVKTDPANSLGTSVVLTKLKDADKVEPLTNPTAFYAKLVELQASKKLKPEVGKTVKQLSDQKNPSATRCDLDEQVHDAFSAVPATDAADQTYDDHFYTCLAIALVGLTWSPQSTGTADKQGQIACGNNVAAVLVHGRKIIGWGLNVMTQHRSLHAETVAIQTYLKNNEVDELPRGCRIYSSLQPCKMCAGFIAHVGRDVKVVYALADRNLTTVLKSTADGKGNKAVLYQQAWLKKPLDALTVMVTSRLLEDGGTTAAMFDKKIDNDYQWAKDQKKRMFTAQHQTELTQLKGKNNRSFQQEGRLKNLEKMKKVGAQLAARGELGLAFANFANFLDTVTTHATKLGNDKKYSDDAIKVAGQCLDLLFVATKTGMSTRYGLEVVNKLLKRENL